MAEVMQQDGHEVVYVTCGRQFREYCVAMSGNGVGVNASAAKKRAVCTQCDRNKELLRQEFSLRGRDISEELESDDYQEIAAILESATPENFLEIESGGVEIGRIALYEFLLNQKKNNTHISRPQWPEYATLLKTPCLHIMPHGG